MAIPADDASLTISASQLRELRDETERFLLEYGFGMREI